MTDRIAMDPDRFDAAPLRNAANVMDNVHETYVNAVAAIGSPLGGRHTRGDIDKKAKDLVESVTNTTAAMLDGILNLVHGDAGNANRAREVFLDVEEDITQSLKSRGSDSHHG
jgi:hypothetical protein